MESVYHIVTIRVNETSRAHVWRLRSHYLGTGYDINVLVHCSNLKIHIQEIIAPKNMK
jgi:hypothetical protein